MKVSIIMAVRNAEQTIEKSLLSLIKQNYEDKEIIIIDGDSTDKTKEIIERYNKYISFFISEPDKNAHDAINKGIQISTGEIIGLLNAGDWYINDHILSDASEKIAPDTDAYCGNLFLQRSGKWRKLKSDKNLESLYSHCSIPILASFFRRSIFDKYGFLDETYTYSGDYEFWFRLYKCGAKFQFFDEFTTLMFDGGASSDPRKGSYQEDRRILLTYGVSNKKVWIHYWNNMIRHSLIRFLRKIKLDSIIMRLLGQEAFLTVAEMKKIGIDIDAPWFIGK